MPDEEQKPSQQPTESDSATREVTRIQQAQDAEILKASGGARPTPPPDPTPQTSSPVNKSTDLTDAARETSETVVVGDSAEAQAKFSRPPASESSGQEGTKD